MMIVYIERNITRNPIVTATLAGDHRAKNEKLVADLATGPERPARPTVATLLEALAGFLQQRCGVAAGDRVLLYAQNGPHFIVGYYAILRADAVVVPVNPMNRVEELRHLIEVFSG